jgi:YebC/PmpR family DNA-binding regulatory protein
MSGHSKWHSIRHKKGAADAKRGKLFGKLIKEVTVAARLGGGDEMANARLRQAVLKARAANMPADNIDRAIKKGAGELGGADFHELLYEAYGPGGVAMLIEILTDNRNRSAAEVRNTLSKHGGNLGDSGSVSYLFKRRGVVAIDGERHSEDEIMEFAIEAGALDVVADDGIIEVLTEPADFESVLQSIQSAELATTGAEITWVADAPLELPPKSAPAAIRLIDLIEDLDDVQSVATNLELPEPSLVTD